jgi:hypothetical protein
LKVLATKEKDGTWRIKTNEGLDHLIKHNNIINQIRAQRLSWSGHVQRMSDNRMVKKIYKWKTIITRLKGRPKSRWDDDVKRDICKMKIKNWTVCVQDRGKWRDVDVAITRLKAVRIQQAVHQMIQENGPWATSGNSTS